MEDSKLLIQQAEPFIQFAMAKMEEDDNPHHLLSLLLPQQLFDSGSVSLHQRLGRAVQDLACCSFGLDLIPEHLLWSRDTDYDTHVSDLLIVARTWSLAAAEGINPTDAGADAVFPGISSLGAGR